MRHDNSVLQQILKYIPWAAFEQLVQAHQADKHVRRLSTKSQLVALLYASLRARSACARSWRALRATRRGSITWASRRCAARRFRTPMRFGPAMFLPRCLRN